MLVSTTNDIVGHRIVAHIGIVRGITVRSRSVVGNFVGGLQSIFGGGSTRMSNSPSRRAVKPSST